MRTNENIDNIFLAVTDTTPRVLQKEENFKLEGHSIMFPERVDRQSKIRIMALIRETLSNQIKMTRDLVSHNFPSIWLEYKDKHKKSTLISEQFIQSSSRTMPLYPSNSI